MPASDKAGTKKKTMKITAKRVTPDVYSLNLGGTEVALEGKDLKILVAEINRVMGAEAGPGKTMAQRTGDFLRNMRNANAVGVQALLRTADQEDVLVLLKIAEKDKVLSDKFNANMSERSRKMLMEDLSYKFRDGLPGPQAAASMTRLLDLADQMEAAGTLVYENISKK
jgi:hypothetical protein